MQPTVFNTPRLYLLCYRFFALCSLALKKRSINYGRRFKIKIDDPSIINFGLIKLIRFDKGFSLITTATNFRVTHKHTSIGDKV